MTPPEGGGVNKSFTLYDFFLLRRQMTKICLMGCLKNCIGKMKILSNIYFWVNDGVNIDPLGNCHECYIREVRSISKQYFEMKFESTFFNRFKPLTKNLSTILIRQSKNLLQRKLFCSQSVKIYGLRHMIVSFHNLQMHIHINDESCRLVSEFIIWIMQIITH